MTRSEGVSSIYDQGREHAGPDGVEPEEQVLRDNAGLRKEISAAATKIAKLKEERKAINEDITAIITDIASKGVNRAAFKAALKLQELSDAEREEHDFSLDVCCKALGIERQRELGLPQPKKH